MAGIFFDRFLLAKGLYTVFYFIITAIPSAFGPTIGDPKTFVDPSSFFHFMNFIFVNAGFLTSMIALVLLGTANRTIGAKPLGSIKREIGAVLGVVVYWVAWRIIFHAIDNVTGRCKSHPSNSRKNCIAGGGQWDGFDISGHCFLIALVTGLFFEEFLAAIQWLWRSQNRQIQSPVPLELGEINKHDESKVNEPTGPPLIDVRRIALLWSGLFLVIFHWMAWTALLIHTSLYFHVFWEKMLGLAIGFIFWWVALGLSVL